MTEQEIDDIARMHFRARDRTFDYMGFARSLILFLQKWQPMDTAPTDGRPVLVKKGDAVEIAWYGHDLNDSDLARPGWWYGEGQDFSTGSYYTPIKPDGWMELPR